MRLVLARYRITINGHTRPLDDVAATLLEQHLAERQRPLATHAQSASVPERADRPDLRQVSEWWLEKPLRGLDVTLKRISMDRQLEEALNHGPDALHLAVLFGIGDRTAMRYADAARRLLTDGPVPDAASATGGRPPSVSGR